MSIKSKIFDLSYELYTSLNDENEEYMLVLIDVIERECLIDNEYLFTIYERISEWKQKKDKSVTEFAEELNDYLNDFRL
jgi:hypothetical protein